MKIKIINTSGYFGLEGVVGKVITATMIDGFATVRGIEFKRNGADKGYFFDEYPYNIPKEMYEVVEDPSKKLSVPEFVDILLNFGKGLSCTEYTCSSCPIGGDYNICGKILRFVQNPKSITPKQ